MNDTPHNPYVGPRTFRTDEGDLFFGREREALDLLSLVISGRLVLFYAQSGAGKSSLINTKLIPGLLAEEEYKILPVGRVGGGTSSSELTVKNIYVYNLAHSLLQQDARRDALSERTLTEFLGGLLHKEDLDDFRHVLIIDQFEELFSTYPQAWEKRKDFFIQLAQALEDFPRLWVVLVMREDYIAYLDPYVHLLPGKLRVHYYMQRLERSAALKAIKNPVENLRPFADGVAEKLVDDLSSVRIQNPDGTVVTQPGQFIEPVQLQVVCYNLWESLPPTGNQITEADLENVGDVNQALERHYANRVREVARKMGVSERAIREWFGKKLITSSGTRNLVLQETKKREGELDDVVIQALQSDLVRAEKRGPSTFYELTHDRLVEPIVASNQKWFDEHLSPLQKQAALWGAQGRTDSWLLSDQALFEVEAWAREHGDELTDIEKDFLEACQKQQEQILAEREAQRRELEIAQKLADTERARAEEKAKSARTSRIIAGIASLLLVISIVLGFQSYENQRTNQMQVLMADASDAFGKGDKLNHDLATLLGYQALIRFGDRGEAEEALGNIVHAIEKNDPVAVPFVVSTVSETHNDVSALGVSPDGQLVASGDPDGTVTLWGLQGSQSLSQLPSTYNTITSLGFSPDGETLAAASYTTITLWDIRNPSNPLEITALNGHTDTVNTIAFSPDGRMLASASYDRTIILWDVATGQPIGIPLAGHSDVVWGVAFSPDGKTLASGSWDDWVIIWDVRDPASPVITAQLKGHSLDVESVAFSPDGKILASASDDKTIILWDIATRQPIGQPLSGHEAIVRDLTFSPDGKTLAARSDDGNIFLWDIESRKPGGPIVAGSSNVVFTPNGKQLVLGSSDGVAVWDVSNPAKPLWLRVLTNFTYGIVTSVNSMSLAPNGRTLAVIGTDDSITLSDVGSGKPTPLPLHPGDTPLSSVAVSWDGKYLALGSDNGAVSVREVATSKAIAHMSHNLRVTSIAFSRDGRYLVTGSYDGNARVWEIPAGKEIVDVRHSGSVWVTAVAFSSDGKYVASAGDKRTILIWDAHRGKKIARLDPESAGDVSSLAFSPDGSRLVIALSYGTVRTVEVWDWTINQIILRIVNGRLKPLNPSVAGMINPAKTVGQSPDKQQEEAQQGGTPQESPSSIVSLAYAQEGLHQDGLSILYQNGVIDHWEIWPGRSELKQYAEGICGTCELRYDQRREYELFTWSMRVADYAGYILLILYLACYGYCIWLVYRSVFNKSTDQNQMKVSSSKKLWSASMQGTLLLLFGVLTWVFVEFLESFFYPEATPDESILWLLLFVLPLGLWAGGAYSHFTRLESGKRSRTKRSLMGMLAGALAGLVVGFLGLVSLGYAITRDFSEVFSDMSIFGIGTLVCAAVGGILSLFGALIYIFWLYPWSEGKVSPKTFGDLLQLWWVRGIIVITVGTLLGFVFMYLDQGYLDSDSTLIIVVISIVLGIFGLMFYPHKNSYIMAVVLGGIGIFLWLTATDSIPLSLGLGLASGLTLSAITSRALHAMRRI